MIYIYIYRYAVKSCIYIYILLPLLSSKAPVVQKLVAFHELQAARTVVLEAAAEGTVLADFSQLKNPCIKSA